MALGWQRVGRWLIRDVHSWCGCRQLPKRLILHLKLYAQIMENELFQVKYCCYTNAISIFNSASSYRNVYICLPV
jgi:hypothetical protein